MRSKTLMFIPAIFFVLVSCSNSTNEKTSTSDSVSNRTSDENAPAGIPTAENKETIHLNITGGERNGRYEAVCTEGCCSWGIAGDKVFGNQYSVTGKSPKELSSIQLLVDNVTGNKSTKEFGLHIGFGQLATDGYNSLNIETRNEEKQGSGQLDLQYAGDKAIVTIKGKSAEGPEIDLKMECDKVLQMKDFGR